MLTEDSRPNDLGSNLLAQSGRGRLSYQYISSILKDRMNKLSLSHFSCYVNVFTATGLDCDQFCKHQVETDVSFILN